jgi:hypothetical protein
VKNITKRCVSENNLDLLLSELEPKDLESDKIALDEQEMENGQVRNDDCSKSNRGQFGNSRPLYGKSFEARVLSKRYQYSDLVKDNSDKFFEDILTPPSGRSYNDRKLSLVLKPYLVGKGFDRLVAGTRSRRKPVLTVRDCYLEYLDELRSEVIASQEKATTLILK